jgi:hypothetical protein
MTIKDTIDGIFDIVADGMTLLSDIKTSSEVTLPAALRVRLEAILLRHEAVKII